MFKYNKAMLTIIIVYEPCLGYNPKQPRLTYKTKVPKLINLSLSNLKAWARILGRHISIRM
jgi:hypothetical protein